MSNPAETKTTPAKRKSAEDDPKPQKQMKKGGPSLPPEAISYLKEWIMSPEHMNNPYPTDEEKEQIMKDTGITTKQLGSWFNNNRKRYWQPKMEAMGKHDIVQAAFASSRALPPQITDYLKAWIMQPHNFENPYPTEDQKAELIAATGIERKQLISWFSNNRTRFWKPINDSIRSQYGLSDSDPLPAEALANLSQHVDSSGSASALPAILAEPAPPHLPPPPSNANQVVEDIDIVAV